MFGYKPDEWGREECHVGVYYPSLFCLNRTSICILGRYKIAQSEYCISLVYF